MNAKILIGVAAVVGMIGIALIVATKKEPQTAGH